MICVLFNNLSFLHSRSNLYFIYKNLSIIILISILVYLSYKLNGEYLGIDDADIFFTYAYNLSKGYGLIYTIESEPVEGYTSTLWMLILSIYFLLGIDNSDYVVFISISILFIILKILIKTLENLNLKNFLYFYLTLVYTSFNFITWNSITLMDTSLWTLGLLIIVYYISLINKKKRFYSYKLYFIGLLTYIRPEFSFYLALFIIILAINNYKKEFIISLLSFTIFQSLIIIFRIVYFGYPLPNTYYAKISNDIMYNINEGYLYFTSYFSSSAITILSFVTVIIHLSNYFLKLIKFFPWSLKKISNINQLLLFVLSTSLIPIILGGDHFNLYRFYQPIYPLLLLASIYAVNNYFRLKSCHSLIIKITIILIFLFLILDNVYISKYSWVKMYNNGSPIKHEFEISRRGRNLGDELNRLFHNIETKPVIGVITAGGISRTYKGKIIDLMGLNNKFIAHYEGDRKGIKNHAAFEPSAFYYLNVDILIAAPDSDFHNIALKNIFYQSEFINNYSYGHIVNEKGYKSNNFFYRKDYVKMLLNKGFKFNEKFVYDYSEKKWLPIKSKK